MQRLQAEAVRLRLRIAKRNDELHALLKQSNEMQILHPVYRYTHLSSEMEEVKTKLSILSRDLAAAERSLPVVYQPLPKDERTAMIILFFIFYLLLFLLLFVSFFFKFVVSFWNFLFLVRLERDRSCHKTVKDI